MTLAYGDSAARAAVRDVLDTLGVQQLISAKNPTIDARLWWVREEFLEALWRRDGLDDWGYGQRAAVSLLHGALGQALERLSEPRVPSYVRANWMMVLNYREFPVSEERLADAFSAGALDSASVMDMVFAAIYAANRDRWHDQAQLVARLGVLVAAQRDSSQVQWVRAAERYARGFGEWKSGRADAGLQLMETAQRDGFYLLPADFIGDLHLELGNLEEAVRYYRSNWVEPIVRVKLAQAYELLGERDKARDAYAYFVEAWADADPELQPTVERARQAMSRLRGDSPR